MARPPRDKNHSANIQEEIEAEARSSTTTVNAAAIAPIEPITWNLERIFTWKKLVRKTTWIKGGIRRLLSHAEQQRRQTPEFGPTEPIRVNGKEIQVEKLSERGATRSRAPHIQTIATRELSKGIRGSKEWLAYSYKGEGSQSPPSLGPQGPSHSNQRSSGVGPPR